MFSLFIDQQCP